METLGAAASLSLDSDMKNRRNYYRILQIQPDAPGELVRSSYRTLLKELKLHPDLGGSNLDAAVLNEAYATLSDPNKRSEYDRNLFARYTKGTLPSSRNRSSQRITQYCSFCKRPLAHRASVNESCSSCRAPLRLPSPNKMQKAWKRSVERMNRTMPLTFVSSWPGKTKQAMMMDLSPQGMRFLCEERIRPDSIVKIDCSLLRASARVTHATKRVIEGVALYSVGVSFLAVSFRNSRGSFFSAHA